MNKLHTIQQELQKTKHLNDKLKAEGVLEVGKRQTAEARIIQLNFELTELRKKLDEINNAKQNPQASESKENKTT
jgi:hypothetical protein